ncbi:hypothetical protein Hanom_Chr07g00595671 [Helianthus anomalus]
MIVFYLHFMSRIMTSHDKRVRIFACTGGSWEIVNEVSTDKPLRLAGRILQLPLNLTYSELKSKVARKFSLSEKHGFRLTYQVPLSSSDQNATHMVVDIADSEDVLVFLDMALKTSNGLITLYVVGSVPSHNSVLARIYKFLF